MIENTSQPIPPTDNRKKLIKLEDIVHFNSEYFKHCGEKYQELYLKILKRSEFYSSETVYDILNNIFDLYIQELKQSNKQSPRELLNLTYIAKIKKELFEFLNSYSDNSIDKIKLLAIIKAYTHDL